MTPWVLVVGQTGWSRACLCEELEQSGFAVETASSVEAALACLAVMRPSAIVMDPELERDGRSRLIAGLRDSRRDEFIPVVTASRREFQAVSMSVPRQKLARQV
jgi:ActR/RegA family two-component response regulator